LVLEIAAILSATRPFPRGHENLRNFAVSVAGLNPLVR